MSRGPAPADLPIDCYPWALQQQLVLSKPIQGVCCKILRIVFLCATILRFQTDANLGGVEKLSISEMRPDFGCRPPFDMSTVEIAPECAGLLAPLGAFMVKGWTRCVCAVTCMLAAYESEEFRAAWPAEVQKPTALV